MVNLVTQHDSNKSVKPTCGYLHVFLIVGPWAIHWYTGSSLVHMEKIDILKISGFNQSKVHIDHQQEEETTGEDFITVDLDTPPIRYSHSSHVLAPLLVKIRDWNISKTATTTSDGNSNNNTNMDVSPRSNCYEFVKECLACLDCSMPMNMSKSFSEYFKRIETQIEDYESTLVVPQAKAVKQQQVPQFKVKIHKLFYSPVFKLLSNENNHIGSSSTSSSYSEMYTGSSSIMSQVKVEFISHKQLENYIHKMLDTNRDTLVANSKYIEQRNNKQVDNVDDSGDKEELILEHYDYPELLTMFRKQYPLDYMLLKSYDRAFWLRKVKQQMRQQMASVDPSCVDCDGSANCCIFGDPMENGSIPVSKWKL